MERDNFSNDFEGESHQDIKCDGCGCKIAYCHGDSDYCSECYKWILSGYKRIDGQWVKKKKSYEDSEEDHLDDFYD